MTAENHDVKAIFFDRGGLLKRLTVLTCFEAFPFCLLVDNSVL
jgi:hypothetical protein